MKKILYTFGALILVIGVILTININTSLSYREPIVNKVEVGVLSSEKHSSESFSLAQDALIKKFKESFKGCTLNKIYYDEVDDIYNEKYGVEPYYEIIVLKADFKTDDKQEVLDLNHDYINYKFVVARKTETSNFRVIDKME